MLLVFFFVLHEWLLVFSLLYSMNADSCVLMMSLRYENIGEYRGSYLDWQRNGGPGTKTPPPV